MTAGFPAPRRQDAADVVDFERYIPSVLSRVVSKLRLSSNAFFGRRFGITLFEWRILSFLAGEGPSSAYTIWTGCTLDKAAVSRALRALKRRGLVSIALQTGPGRRKTCVALTPDGDAVHDATFDEIVVRHARLLNGISDGEIATFLSVLHRLEAQIPHMGDGPVPEATFRMTKAGRRAAGPKDA
jgi:DNA-binding MarR family transcriptional regulator